MPRRRRGRFAYSPALDGVRGTAMVLFMAFHFGATWLPGAWVGINLFFVLSAFLITRLLACERAQFGSIDALAFYRRRARRLLPGLLLMLGALCVYGLTAAPAMVRRPMRGDILATLAYVQNWHLISLDDQYFESFNPSYLRHAWTLAVEEQFYLFVPVVVLVLAALFRRRAMQSAVLLIVGGLSAVWTAHIGVATMAAQAHAYYGTDTRAQALCIGAAVGLWAAPRRDGRSPRQLSVPTLAVLGWGGLIAMGIAYLTIAPFTGWMFERGGMYAFALASAALVVACADPDRSLLHRVMGWAPFAYLGRISYGLYLWHWPVHLWLDRAAPQGPAVLKFVIGMVVTTSVAAASYRYLERPVIQGGLRALIPHWSRRTRRSVVTASFAALVAGAVAVGSVPSAAAVNEAAAARGIPLVSGQGPYEAHGTTTSVALIGDSVPYYLTKRFPADVYSDLRLTNLGVPGCDLMDLPMDFAGKGIQRNGPKCRGLKQDLTTRLRKHNVQVLVIFWGTLIPVPHVTVAGRHLTLDDPAYRKRVVSRLNAIRRHAREAGVRQVQVVTVPCRTKDPTKYGVDEQMIAGLPDDIIDELTDPKQTNALLTTWAHRHDVPVLDLYGRLCSDGFRPRIHGVKLYGDSIHFGVQSSPMIWTWLAPQIRSAYDRRDRAAVGGAS